MIDQLTRGVVVSVVLEMQLEELSPGTADRVRRELVRLAASSTGPRSELPESVEAAGLVLRYRSDQRTGTLVAESVTPVDRSEASASVRLKILLVDDDRFALTLLGDRLIQLEHHVVSVESGEEALREGLEGFDAIVCDYLMPGMNGAELLRRVRGERGSDIPFIFVTGARQPEELVREAIRLDADFLPKPVKVAQLVDLIVERKQGRSVPGLKDG